MAPSLARSLSNKSDQLVDEASKSDHSHEEPEAKVVEKELQPLQQLHHKKLEELKPWSLLSDVIKDTVSPEHVCSEQLAKIDAKKQKMADAVTMQRLVLHAQRVMEKTSDMVWGPENLIKSASCFNWALCAGELGYDEHSAWPPALFDWVSVAERSIYPWRSEGKPWKTISLVAVQKRCAETLASLPSVFRSELDRITSDHLQRVARLSRKGWKMKERELESRVATEVMRLAVRIAGMEPCAEAKDSYIIAMRGKSGVACNFTHWWLELPTGRHYKSGEPERVRCESYPNAPVYFTPCYLGQTPRGTYKVHVKRLLPQHLRVVALGLLE